MYVKFKTNIKAASYLSAGFQTHNFSSDEPSSPLPNSSASMKQKVVSPHKGETFY